MITTDYNAKFSKDLKEGNAGEKVIASWLEKNEGFSILEYGNDKRFDIVSERAGRKILLEVKTDRFEWRNGKKTGNIFIETTCSGKVSGIHTTESDIFIYFFPDFEIAYFIKVKDLKNLIKEHPFRRTSRSGDKGKVTGLLIDREKFASHFNIKTIGKAKIWDILDSQP